MSVSFCGHINKSLTIFGQEIYSVDWREGSRKLKILAPVRVCDLAGWHANIWIKEIVESANRLSLFLLYTVSVSSNASVVSQTLLLFVHFGIRELVNRANKDRKRFRGSLAI
jgi:hypothetical protein